MNLSAQFKAYLFSQKNPASKVTVKNYVSDVNRFIAWYESKFGNEFNPSEVSHELINNYKLECQDKYSSSSIDRSVSSLRKFFTFLKLESIISQSPFEAAQVKVRENEVDPWKIRDFKNYLYVLNASPLTMKNYVIDVKQFKSWLESTIPADASWNSFEAKNLVASIDSRLINDYKIRLLNDMHLSPVSVNRKLSSLRRYTAWAKEEGIIKPNIQVINEPKLTTPDALALAMAEAEYIPQEPKAKKGYSKFPPLRAFQKSKAGAGLLLDAAVVAPVALGLGKLDHALWIAKGKPVFDAAESVSTSSITSILEPMRKPNGPVKNVPKSFYSPTSISIANFPIHKKAIHHAKYSRPEWYRKYHSYTFVSYLHFSILMIIISVIGYMIFNNVEASQKQKPSVLASLPSAPNRHLSFQGRLTDEQGAPINQNTNLRIGIYTSQTATGSALLWQEVISTTPDSDGIFNIMLGKGTPIPSTLFSQNSSLWLGVTVERTKELAPRQPIATVAYASNAETLQGLPPITTTTATANVILALNSSGNLTIGGRANPTFQATGGTFTLSGNTVMVTTNTGSNGNIALAPNGTGLVDIQKAIVNTTSNGSPVPGAVIVNDVFVVSAGSSGQGLFGINQTSSGDLITASTSGSTRFRVDNGGNVTANGTINGLSISSGTISSGTWNGTAISPTYGGTGLNTSASTGVPIISSGTWSVQTLLETGYGGTGISTYNIGDIIYANASDNLDTLTIGSNATCLISNGTTPTWGSCSTGGTDSPFQVTSGAINPLNSTLDFLVGGQSSTAAKFAVLNVNGSGPVTATLSGNLIVMPTNGEGGKIGIGISNPTTLINATASGQFSSERLDGANILSTYKFGQSITDSSANTIRAFHVESGLDMVTNPSSIKLANGFTSSVVSPSNSTAILTNLNIRALNGNFIHQGTGTIGTAIANAQSTQNVGAGTITNAMVWQASAINSNASGNIGTLKIIDIPDIENAGTITNTYGVYVGDITTGTQTNTPYSFYASDANAYNYFAGNVGIGISIPAQALHVVGTSRLDGATTINDSSGNVFWNFGVSHVGTLTCGLFGTNSCNINSGSHLILQSAGVNKPVSIGNPTTSAALSVRSGYGSNSLVIFDQPNSGDILTASSSGTTRFSISNNGDVRLTAGISLSGSTGTASQCLLGGSSASWGSCSTGGTDSPFQVTSGAINPLNSTLDFLVGGQSSTAAKFAVLNVNTGTPTASISGNSGNIATYITGTGQLGTTNRQSLIIGNTSTNNTTGNVLINSNGTGNVGIGTSAPERVLEITNSYPVIRYNREGSYYWDAGVGDSTNGIPLSYFGFRDAVAGRNALTIAHTTGNVGIGTTNSNVLSALHVTHPLAFTANGKALVIFDQIENQPIFTASASGVTAFVIENDGITKIGNVNTTQGLEELTIGPETDGSTDTAIALQNNGEEIELHFEDTNMFRFTRGDEIENILSIDSANRIGLGTVTQIAEFHVTRPLSLGTTGKALAVFDQIENQDILTASKSGTTMFTIESNGTVDIASGATYQINNTNVLSSTTLGSGITASSLTSLGTLSSLTVTGATNINTSGSSAVNIGTSTYTGNLSLGNASANVAITDANWSISGAGAASLASLNANSGGITNAGAISGATTIAMSGALTGVTTITTSGAINGQTISSAANFTGTVTVAGTGTALTLSGAATTAIDISNSGVTTDISLQNAETISNNTDGLVQFSGAIGSGYNFNGSTATFPGSSGGFTMGWNFSSGQGEVDLITRQGAGASGGFRIYDWDGATATQMMSLSSAGYLDIAADIEVSGNDIRNSAGDSRINIGSTAVDLIGGGLTLTVSGTSGVITLSTLDVSTGNRYLCWSTSTTQVTSAGSGANCSTSSREFKENIEDLDYGLDEIMQLRSVTFNYKASHDPDTSKKIGFIAEEVAPIIPELAIYEKGKLKSLNYENMTAVLVRGVQQQQLMIQDQESRIAALDQDYSLTNSGELQLAIDANENFEVRRNTSNGPQVISRIGGFSNLVVANFKAGYLELGRLIVTTADIALATIGELTVNTAQIAFAKIGNLTTDSLAIATENVTIAGVGIRDYIYSIVDTRIGQQQIAITAPITEADIIKPKSSNNLTVKLPDHNSKLIIQNSSSSAVASFDAEGNASLSGKLVSNGIETTDATISGTLRATKIIADDIELSEDVLARLEGITLASPSSSINNNYITNNYYSSTPSSSLSPLLAATGISSGSGILNGINADYATFTNGLIAFGPSSFFEISVADRLFIGSQLSIADRNINVLGGDLELQPLRQGGIAFVGGEVRIDNDGNLKVNGNAVFAKNVEVGGRLAAGIIAPIPGKNLVFEFEEAAENSKVEFKTGSGSAVLSVTNKGDVKASGSGTFNKLNLSFIPKAIAVTDTEVIATGSAGTTEIKANQKELTIKNPLVTKDSLIYITPKTGTPNQSVYLLRQVPGESFTVGLSKAINKSVPFNWILIN